MNTDNHSHRTAIHWSVYLVLLISLVTLTSCGRKEESSDPAAFASGWFLHKTEHFALMDPPDSPRADHMHSMGEACEDIYRQLSALLDVKVPDRIWVYRFVTASDCQSQTGFPPGTVEGHRIYTRIGAPVGGAIAIAACDVIAPGHETFPLVRDGLREAFDNQTGNVHREASLLRANDLWVPLADLVDTAAVADRNVYNTEAASFVAYLIQRHGVPRFKELWAGSGELATVLERVYGGSIAQLEEDWINHLEREANRT